MWGALDNAARREGVAVVQAATAYMTVRCAACGHQNRWDTAASIVQQCAACGQVWDQDWHAARNLLDWLASQTPPPAAPAAGLRAEPAAG